MTAAASTALPLTRSALANRYELLAVLGSGGMGAVYLARDNELGELVAVKMIHPELARDEVALANFRNEVRLARRVTHVNVARTFDIGEHDGARFLTMQYVEGESLSSILAREAPLSTPRVVRIAEDVCAGLAAAHEAGVIHRDLKPQNVLVARDGGRAVITDFGIALSSSEVQAATADVVGTPMYMAPEQLRGGAVDARSDIYSFGAMLFVMATGHRPFNAKAPRTADTPAPDPRWHKPSLVPHLADVIVRCMALDPGARYADAIELRHELSRIATTCARVGAVSDAVRERRAIRRARDERLRSVAVAPIPAHGIDASYGDGIRAALLTRLAEKPGLHAVPAEKATLAPESSLRATVRLEDGLLALDLVLESRDGYQVLAEQLRGTPNEALVLADRAAAAVSRALAMPARRLPAPAVARSDAAMDLYFRARAEYRGFFMGSVNRAIELFREADALSPDHPLILSALAIALARKCWFDGSGIEIACRTAERAVTVGADRAEAYLAMSSVAFQSNDAKLAATSLARALSIAPSLVEAQVMLARLFSEIGAPVDALTLGHHTLERAPDTFEVIPELIRTYGLLGDFEAAAKLFTRVPVDSPGYIIASTGRARIASWRRDDPFLDEYLPMIRGKLGSGSALVVIEQLTEVRAGRRAPGTVSSYDAMLPQNATPRRKAHHYQIVGEAFAMIGDATNAVEAIERSTSLGLCDALWFGRCPNLDLLRGNARFEAAHDEVRTRGLEALAAFDAIDAADAAPADPAPATDDLANEHTAVQTRR